ncbi:MAG: VCBS repeat-containing protein [Planctomycetales bacterium]|nr:VCBS repeat-containing protein [Planctomycetales bacterium]
MSVNDFISTVSSLVRTSLKQSRTPRRAHRKLAPESLEDRRVLAAIGLTAQEQLLLELVNRARENPLAEVARYPEISNLNSGLPAGTLTSTPKQPLAPNPSLINAARMHSQDMLNNNYFSHVNLQGLSPSDRARNAGYGTGAGENIAWGGSTVPVDEIDQVYERHKALFLSPGHRENILEDDYREIGNGVRYGIFTTFPPQTDPARDWYAAMVTENFGNRGGNFFLTGVAFTDAVVSDDFYTVGEGVGNITVVATNASTGAVFSTITGSSGGYTLQVPAGSYNVVASGGGMNGTLSSTATVSSQNVKVDFVTTRATGGGGGATTPPPAPDSPPAAHPAEDIVAYANGVWYQFGSNGSSFDTQIWGSWSNTTWYDVATGDFNGDGDTDIVGRNSAGDWYVASSSGDRFSTASWGHWSNVVTWDDVRVADLNGDGRDDLVGRTNGQWWSGISNGSSFENQYWGRWSANLSWDDVRVGDFTGDGRADIAGRTSGQWWVASSTGSSFENSYWGRWSTAVDWQDVMVGDFDNDGRDDLVGRANGAWWIANSNGSAFRNEFWAAWTTTISWEDVQIADVNGDGRDDILGRANGAWWVARSTGSAFANQYLGSWSNQISWQNVMVLDANNDGRDDVVGRAGNEWWVALSNGSEFANQKWGMWQLHVAPAYTTTGVFS